MTSSACLDDLFAAVTAVPASALARFDTAFEGPDEHLGERVVRAYLGAWEGSPDESEPLMAMLRGAVTNESACVQLREFIQSRLMHGTGDGADDDAMLRAGLAAAMLVATVGPAIQRVLVGAAATGSQLG